MSVSGRVAISARIAAERNVSLRQSSEDSRNDVSLVRRGVSPVTVTVVFGMRAASCSLVVMRHIGSKFCWCKNTAEGGMVERQKNRG